MKVRAAIFHQIGFHEIIQLQIKRGETAIEYLTDICYNNKDRLDKEIHDGYRIKSITIQ